VSVQKNDYIKYNLSIKNGKYYLEIIDKVNNKTIRTNNQTEIFESISQFRNYADRVIEYDDKLKFLFDDTCVILNDYETYKDKNLYSYIHDGIDEHTKIYKGVKRINKKKLATLLLTGATIVTLGISGIAKLTKDEIQASNQTSTDITYVTPTPIPTATPIPIVTQTPIETPSPTVTPIPENVNRLMETVKLKNNDINNSEIIPIATNLNDYALNRITDFFQTEGWNYIQKYSSEFGIDPYLLLAIGYSESNLLHEKTLPDGSSYNGFAVGRFQHETPDKEWNITAFNYQTNKFETVRMTMENAKSEEMNTKMAAMILQNRLYEFNNNIYLTLQSYNYGIRATNIIIDKYAEEINSTNEDVKNNYSDIGWMKYVKDFHNNPQDYIKWDYKTYGDENYIQKVLGYYIGTETINYDDDGNLKNVNLIAMDNSYGTISRWQF